MEDIHRSYDRLWMLTDSMEYIPHIDTALLDEAKQALLAFADCVEEALAMSEEEKPTRPSDEALELMNRAARYMQQAMHLRVIR
jgi:hypothetical protein